MRVLSISRNVLFALFLLPLVGTAQTKSAADRHAGDDQWVSIAAHLPDRKTAEPARLEMAGDILRARKYDEDALEMYQAAIDRGGDRALLTNKIGLIQLGMNENNKSRTSFQTAVKLRKKYPEAWSNLATVDYIDGNASMAMSEYKRAIKFDRNNAVYHSNLAAVYFNEKDITGAQKELRIALRLDPQIFEHRNRSGITAHIATGKDRARYCYELAKVYAGMDDRKNMLLYLARAAESGFDVADAMILDHVFDPYRKDPSIELLLKNTRAFLASLEDPPKPAEN